jgi:anti-sigma factor RsiW
LEDELSPSQHELASNHLDACVECADLASRISGQDRALASLSPDRDPRLEQDTFWGPMNDAVDAAWDTPVPAEPTQRERFFRREFRVTPVGLLAYAAALLLALSWGWSNHLDAQQAANQADVLRAEQQPSHTPVPSRIASPPASSTQPYQPVRYTPRRGTL